MKSTTDTFPEFN